MKGKAISEILMRCLIAGLAVLTIATVLGTRGAAQSGPTRGTPEVGGRTLRRVATIDLPGPAGQRFDYLTFDDEGRNLFSAHLAPGLLYVLDLRYSGVAASSAASSRRTAFSVRTAFP